MPNIVIVLRSLSTKPSEFAAILETVIIFSSLYKLIRPQPEASIPKWNTWNWSFIFVGIKLAGYCLPLTAKYLNFFILDIVILCPLFTCPSNKISASFDRFVIRFLVTKLGKMDLLVPITSQAEIIINKDLSKYRFLMIASPLTSGAMSITFIPINIFPDNNDIYQINLLEHRNYANGDGLVLLYNPNLKKITKKYELTETPFKIYGIY